MISQKFANLSNDSIAEFISETKTDVTSVIESIDSVSDLWILAKMKETFDEENNIHSNVADSYPDVLPTS